MLRTTRARWLKDGTYHRVLETGAPVIERMYSQYQAHLHGLWATGQSGWTGEATPMLPPSTQLLRWRKRQDISSCRAAQA